MGALGKKKLAELRDRMQQQREDLSSDSAVSEDSRAPVVLDQTTQGRLSRMDALQVQAMAIETQRRRETEIKRIDAALRRMETGDYGYCVVCGEEIAPRRLEHDPAVPTCIDCARDI